MIPNLMKSKNVESTEANVEDDKILAPIFNSANKKRCCKCPTKGNAVTYVVLFKDDNEFKPMCSKCLNEPLLSHDIIHTEHMATYHKRLKTGFYRNWRINAENSKNPRVGD
jgi:hypothetical protein